MNEVTVYDVDGVPCSAVLVDGIPEIESDGLLMFDFRIKVVTSGDSILWLFNGKKHRLDGPAIECSTGRKAWYVDGIEFSKSDFPRVARRFLSLGLRCG